MPVSVSNELPNFSVFSEFTNEEVAELLPFIREESYKSKEIICEEGDPADRAFFLMRGEALEKKALDHDQEIIGFEPSKDKYVIRRYGPGQHFTLHALLSPTSVHGSIVANAACQVVTLSRTAFDTIQHENSGLAYKIMKGICQSLITLAQDSERALGMEIQNSLLIEQMRVEKKKIMAMHRIANSTALGSVKKTLETILDACMDCLAVEKGSVMIHDKGFLRVEAAFGPDQEKIVGKTQKITDASVSGRCFMSQKPILIGDIEAAQDLKRAGGGKKYANNSVLSLPLVSQQGMSIGVLNVSKTSKELFNDKDLHILTDLAQEASTALGHEIYLARIFKEFQDAYIDIRRGREKMEAIEKRVYDCIGISWVESGG